MGAALRNADERNPPTFVLAPRGPITARQDGTVTATGMDSWDRIVGRERPAKGEKAATAQRLGDDETVLGRFPVTAVRQSDDGQTVMEGAVVAVVTDRRLILLHSTGGFRPEWSALTLGFGQLEPPVERDPATAGIRLPTSGRRGYLILADGGAGADRFTATAAQALGRYRRERMGLPD